MTRVPGDGSSAGDGRKLLPAMYLLALLLALLPAWTVRYPATVDGPTHVLNASILRSLALDADSPYATTFAIDWRPVPYWTLLAALALLLVVTPVAVAHQLAVAGLVVLVALSAAHLRRTVQERSDPLALLAVPVAAGLLFHLGLYSHLLGVGLLQLALAYWWQRRRTLGRRQAALLAGLLAALWLTHLLVWLVGVATIAGGATLLDRQAERAARLRAIAAALAVVPALLRLGSSSVLPSHLRLAPDAGVRYLLQGEIVSGFAPLEMATAPLVPLAVLALTVLAIARTPRPSSLSDSTRVFGLASGVSVLLVVLAPDSVGDGTFVKARFAAWGLLFALAAIPSPRDPRTSRAVAVLAVAVLAWRCWVLVPQYRHYDRTARAVISALAGVQSGERVVVVRGRGDDLARAPRFALSPVANAAAWAAAAGGWNLVGSRVQSRWFQPVHQTGSPDAARWIHGRGDVRELVDALDFEGYDLLFAWRLPARWSTSPEFTRAFRVRSVTGAGVLAERRSPEEKPDSGTARAAEGPR